MTEEQKKKCVGCKQVKPLREFTKNKYQRDGLAIACRECLRAKTADRRKNYALGERRHGL